MFFKRMLRYHVVRITVTRRLLCNFASIFQYIETSCFFNQHTFLKSPRIFSIRIIFQNGDIFLNQPMFFNKHKILQLAKIFFNHTIFLETSNILSVSIPLFFQTAFEISIEVSSFQTEDTFSFIIKKFRLEKKIRIAQISLNQNSLSQLTSKIFSN